MRWASSIAVLLVALVVMIISVQVGADTREFSRYNIEWNGTSALFDRLDKVHAHEIFSYRELAGARNTTLLVIAPLTPLGNEEKGLLREFVRSGNTLVVVDDFGNGSRFLEASGSTMRISPVPVASADRILDDPSSVLGKPYQPNNRTTGVPSLVCNLPSSVEGGDPLITTSLLSWQDLNRNGRVEEREPLGRYTLLGAERVGNGTVLALADPSIWINGVAERGDAQGNFALLSGIVQGSAQVFVDQVHTRTGDSGPYTRLINDLKGDILLRMVVLVLCLAAVCLLARRRTG